MKRFFEHISAFAGLLAFLMLAACAPVNLDPQDGDSSDLPADMMRPGDQVVFSSSMPVAVLTKAGETSEETDGYHYVRHDDPYDFDITMLGAGGVPLATATYSTVASESNDHGYLFFNDSSREPLLWYSFDEAFAFRVVSGAASVGPDQSTYEKLLAHDRLEGYAGHPGAAAPAPVYKKAKEWYEANKAMGLSASQDFNKRVPLFLEHRKSKISVILKAGEGVDRNILEHTRAATLVDVSIFSYPQSGEAVDVKPYLTKAEVTYPDGVKIESACYEAIVEPYHYADDTHVTGSKIAAINVSGMKFSFYAANDEDYGCYINPPAGGKTPQEYLADLQANYNLEPGRHLVIEVTLSTADRKILITAYVTDWDERSYATVCNDYGTKGDATIINDATEFAAFLADEKKNAPGRIAYIAPASIPLPDTWDSGKTLNATLNAAGARIITSKRLFNVVNGYFVNAEVQLTAGATNVNDAAVALTSTGIIERIRVNRAADAADVSLQRAGIVVSNNGGTIYKCSSDVPVVYTGTAGTESDPVYIGGIVAESTDTFDGTTVASIAHVEYCTVTARVSSEVANVRGAGIVARAHGVVDNNVFEYGISLIQDQGNFKNILYSRAPGANDLLTSTVGNEWPTLIPNSISSTEGDVVVNNRPSAQLYTQVIDSAKELRLLVQANSSYNNDANRFRIANDFTVTTDDWTLDGGTLIGRQSDVLTVDEHGNVFFELVGNNKSITLAKGTKASAPMLFSNIVGMVRDLTVICQDPLVSRRSTEEETTFTAVAPLGYSVSRQTASGQSGQSTTLGTVSNVTVKMAGDAYVEAMNPGGILVWAFNGGVVENCQSDSELRVWLPRGISEDNTFFAGGIVSQAASATVKQCRYYKSLPPSAWIYDSNLERYVDYKNTVYFGGIVGGTNTWQSENPCLLIADSSSRIAWTVAREAWGGIVGYSVYSSGAGQALVNGMSADCQGNWWNASTFVKGVGRKVDSMTEEKVIGKRNSVDPSWGSF